MARVTLGPGTKLVLHTWTPFSPPATLAHTARHTPVPVMGTWPPRFPPTAITLLPSQAIPKASCSVNPAGLGCLPGSRERRGLFYYMPGLFREVFADVVLLKVSPEPPTSTCSQLPLLVGLTRPSKRGPSRQHRGEPSGVRSRLHEAGIPNWLWHF